MRAIRLAAVLAAGAASLAFAGPHTSASNRRAAHNEARHLLSLLVLPAGAVSSPTDPSVHKLLASPGLGTGTVALVDRHRFWRVSGDPAAVLASIEARAPAGSRVIVQGSSSGPSGDTRSVDFGFSAIRGVLLSRSLVVTVADAGGGGTAVRADAEVQWVQPRSRYERVPRSAHVVSITDTRLNTHTGRSTTSAPMVITGAKVRRIAALVDALPRDQLGLVPCPVDFGPNVDLKFYGVQGGVVLAEADADGSGCGTVSFSRDGRVEPALSGGPGLIKRLGRLLGVNF